LNPRTWVPKASTLPLDHRSPRISLNILKNNISYPCRDLDPGPSSQKRSRYTDYTSTFTLNSIETYQSTDAKFCCIWNAALQYNKTTKLQISLLRKYGKLPVRKKNGSCQNMSPLHAPPLFSIFSIFLSPLHLFLSSSFHVHTDSFVC
jgi:hypothetical protein